MLIEIQRTHVTMEVKESLLRINGERVCDCAEYAPTALAEGIYPLLIHHCRTYQRKMPPIITDDTTVSGWSLALMKRCERCPSQEIVNHNAKLPCYCPMLKIGNGVHRRTDGSVIIGERIVSGSLKHPQGHFNRLIDRLKKAQRRGEQLLVSVR